MANRRKGRRHTVVNGHDYAWRVADESDGEGCWTLLITADEDWQKQIVYPLTESGLRSLADTNAAIPMPEEFDRQTGDLDCFHTTEIGNDRHVRATPNLVHQLVAWYSENVWKSSNEES